MYETHGNLKTPPDDTPIWRYMDFTKFVSMLDNRALFFTKANELPDPWEGAHTKAYIEMVKKAAEEAGKNSSSKLESLRWWTEQMRGETLVNCWHMNNDESAAMWKMYAKSVDAVAVLSSVGRLKECFSALDYPIFIGEVSYRDYDSDTYTVGNFFLPFVSKRKSFEYERELRAMTSAHLPPRMDLEAVGKGLFMPVDLELLLDCVFVAPEVDEWLLELVTSVLRKYELAGFKTHQSRIYEPRLV